MTEVTEVVPNYKKIEGFLNELSEEYDLDSRFNRYESMTPELIELAKGEGLEDKTQAIHALFIADFVLTSSEVTSGTTDEDRRKSIIQTFIQGLKSRTESSMSILEAFFLSQKVYIGLKRNDSFLAGRGIETYNRAFILFDMYVNPLFVKLQEILGEGPLNWELGIFYSMIKKELPDVHTSNYLNEGEMKLTSEEAFVYLFTIIEEFVKLHDAELNPDSPLPNINESAAIYQVASPGDIHLAKFNIQKNISKESVETNSNLQKFLNDNDSTNALVFLRGKLLGSQKHIILSRNPFVEGKPLVIFKSPLSDINSTEMYRLLELRGNQNEGLSKLRSSKIINQSYFETIEKEVTEVQEKEIVVQEEYKEEVEKDKSEEPKKKKKGFFGKIKSLFFGGGDKDDVSEDGDPETVTKKRDVTRTVQEEVKKLVQQKVERKKRIGVQLADESVKSLGLYVLEDLRIFEEFDTLRETEYEIIGALESSFTENQTSVLSTSKFANSDEIFTLLDGLDEVIEAVANYYFDEEHQLIPEEMLFLSDDNKHFILCLDGNEKGIVATIAKTFSKEITDWQSREQVDTVQRRTLHMRTGQLLSAREHTPFDRAAERIYGDALGENTNIDTIDRAILSLN